MNQEENPADNGRVNKTLPKRFTFCGVKVTMQYDEIQTCVQTSNSTTE
jgi:hypothetical protein